MIKYPLFFKFSVNRSPPGSPILFRKKKETVIYFKIKISITKKKKRE